MTKFPDVAAKLGTFMSETLETFQGEIGDQEVEVGETMIITEFRFPPDEENERGRTGLMMHCSDERVWIQLGLVSTVLEDLKEGGE